MRAGCATVLSMAGDCPFTRRPRAHIPRSDITSPALQHSRQLAAGQAAGNQGPPPAPPKRAITPNHPGLPGTASRRLRHQPGRMVTARHVPAREHSMPLPAEYLLMI
jgi:hypothetical protein